MNGAPEIEIDITPSVGASLVDATLERSVVASLIARPDLLEHIDARLDLTTLGDLQAQCAWIGIADLRAAGTPINAHSVAARIRERGYEGAADWYPRLIAKTPAVIRPDVLAEQSRSIVRLADKRAAAIESGEEAVRAEAEIDELALRDAEPTTPAPKWRFVTATPDWITTPLPPREHLLTDTRTGRGAMDKTGVWLFGGPGGAGKSYALIDLGLTVASGATWFGAFKVDTPGRSLTLAAEDSCEDIRRRVHPIAKAKGTHPSATERLVILPLHDRVTSLVAKVGDTYAPSDHVKSLCDELATHDPYALTIVDPYGRIAGVSVDADNAAAAATISALSMISTATRGLVLGVTHTSLRARIAARNGAPEGSTGIRGATGQTDYARGVLRLEKDEEANAIWLSLAKANHVAPWQPVGLRRGDHGELVPIDAVDLATIAVAKSKDGKRAKREAAIADRDEADDVAAAKAIADNPGASLRVLRAIVCKERRCGKDRADNAISRCRP